jgi:hypothetical protein
LTRDNGNVLYNRISAKGYKECQNDILAVSGMAEDIRDALLDYQVCDDKAYAAALSLKLVCFDRWPSNRRYMTRIAD